MICFLVQKSKLTCHICYILPKEIKGFNCGSLRRHLPQVPPGRRFTIPLRHNLNQVYFPTGLFITDTLGQPKLLKSALQALMVCIFSQTENLNSSVIILGKRNTRSQHTSWEACYLQPAQMHSSTSTGEFLDLKIDTFLSNQKGKS